MAISLSRKNKGTNQPFNNPRPIINPFKVKQPKKLKENIKNELITKENKTYQKMVVLRIDKLLLDKIKSLVNSSRLSGNYQYPSIASFLKESLVVYREKQFPLSYQCQLQNLHTKFNFRLDDQISAIYYSLPLGSRTEMIERISGTLLSIF